MRGWRGKWRERGGWMEGMKSRGWCEEGEGKGRVRGMALGVVTCSGSFLLYFHFCGIVLFCAGVCRWSTGFTRLYVFYSNLHKGAYILLLFPRLLCLYFYFCCLFSCLYLDQSFMDRGVEGEVLQRYFTSL